MGIPCVTTMPGILAAVQGIEAMRTGAVPRSLQEYHSAVPQIISPPSTPASQPPPRLALAAATVDGEDIA
jgi:hypothetical protein